MARGKRELSEICCIPAWRSLEVRSRFSSPCSFGALAAQRSANMDATTIAALAVAIQESHAAAIQQLLLDRERAAMANEDARSRLAAHAQRHQDVLQARRATRAAQRAIEDETALVCVLCQRRSRRIVQMAPIGTWAGLTPDQRLVCSACHRLQPPQ